MDTIPEAEPARPWRAEDGAQPVVWTWPKSDPPVLWVRSGGAWRYATVMAKQVWADGSTVYQVAIDLRGDTSVSARLYRWPQPGLKVAHRSRFEPSKGVDEAHQGDMPRRGPAGR